MLNLDFHAASSPVMAQRNLAPSVPMLTAKPRFPGRLLASHSMYQLPNKDDDGKLNCSKLRHESTAVMRKITASSSRNRTVLKVEYHGIPIRKRDSSGSGPSHSFQ